MHGSVGDLRPYRTVCLLKKSVVSLACLVWAEESWSQCPLDQALCISPLFAPIAEFLFGNLLQKTKDEPKESALGNRQFTKQLIWSHRLYV